MRTLKKVTHNSEFEFGRNLAEPLVAKIKPVLFKQLAELIHLL